MKILGLQFKDDDSIETIFNELKRRGLNPNYKTIPVFYAKEQMRIQNVKEFKLSAQELIEVC